MYTIQCRYEYFSSNGKEWTKWFNHGHSENPEEEIKILKEKSKEVDRITKLKHEYRYVEENI